MKKLAALIVLLLVGFYVLWPAWSGYVIREAIRQRDPAALADKIDFERVRASLTPYVRGKAEEGIGRYQGQLGGAGGVLVEQLKREALPKLVDATLKGLLTPEAIIRLATETGSFKASMDRTMGAPAGADVPVPGGIGGALGDIAGGILARRTAPRPAEPAPSAPAAQAKTYSLANVKSISMAGPTSIRLGIAKDAAAAGPDLLIELSFTGLDWKLTGVTPTS